VLSGRRSAGARVGSPEAALHGLAAARYSRHAHGKADHVTLRSRVDEQAGLPPVESNEVIRKCGWQAVDPPAPVHLRAASFPRS
jgi:hypothetical protein